MSDESKTLTALTAKIVAAYVGGDNPLPPSELPNLIGTIYRTLGGAPESRSVSAENVKATPAQIRKSITPDLLISFEDGVGYKMLKRHLTRLGMTAADYRTKWGLPADYPTTAPNYSAARSALAKKIGLGQSRRKPAAVAQSTSAAKKATKARAPGS